MNKFGKAKDIGIFSLVAILFVLLITGMLFITQTPKDNSYSYFFVYGWNWDTCWIKEIRYI